MNQVRLPLWLAALCLWWLCLFSPGCRDALGPEKMPVATVDGRVSENGRPVSRGWIEFTPVDGTIGKLRSARLRQDGTFHATNVPVGLNLIRLVNVDIDPRVARVFGAFHSPIRRTIPEKPGPRIEIDVVDEASKYQASLSRQNRLEPAVPRVEQ